MAAPSTLGGFMFRKPNSWLGITGPTAGIYTALAIYADLAGGGLLGEEGTTRLVFIILALAFAVTVLWKIGADLVAPVLKGQAEIKAMIEELRNGGYAEGYADGLARKPAERHLNSVR